MSVASWLDYVDKSFKLSPSETSVALSNLFVLDINHPIVSSLQNDILDVRSTLILGPTNNSERLRRPSFNRVQESLRRGLEHTC